MMNQGANFLLVNFSSSTFCPISYLKIRPRAKTSARRKYFSNALFVSAHLEEEPANSEKSNISSEGFNHATKSKELRPFPPTSPTEILEWGGRLPSRRRVLAGSTFVLFATLGSNFLSSTSGLLSFFPSESRSLKLDLIYPINGFRRCIERTTGFEFVYPDTWVGDQTLLYRAINRAEQERSLDLPSLRSRRRVSVTEPLVAFGPPGSEGELNVSVVVAPVAAGFRLEAFGSPLEVGKRILSSVIAPSGSDKEAILLRATQRRKGQVLYYTLEFTVQGPNFFRHNLAVYAVYNGSLYSLNAQSAATGWDEFASQFEFVADSFEVTAGGADQNLEQNVPTRL